MDGFKVLPVKFSEKSQGCHYLFYKPHNVRESHSAKPSDKTLFVLNVPPYCNEECVKRLFGDCGNVADVFFQSKPSSGPPPTEKSKFFGRTEPIYGFKVAYVVFQKPRGVENAMKLDVVEPRILSPTKDRLKVGIHKWCAEYRNAIPDVYEMQKEIEAHMAEYDKSVEAKKKEEKQMEGVADDEGWITVTRTGKKRGIARTEANIEKITHKQKKKRSQKELLNFYTFQIRETKMEHIAQLRKKFEEDKKKIEVMKATRKFKPF